MSAQVEPAPRPIGGHPCDFDRQDWALHATMQSVQSYEAVKAVCLLAPRSPCMARPAQYAMPSFVALIQTLKRTFTITESATGTHT